MFRLAGNHLCGKLLFTWLSLVMSLLVSSCAVFFFPRDVLDVIWDLIESVSEGFLTYSLFNFEVLMPNEYSDHSPLCLSFLKQNHSNVSSDSTSASQNKIFWKSDKEPLFRQHITESVTNLNPIHNANCTINEKVGILSCFSLKIQLRCSVNL